MGKQALDHTDISEVARKGRVRNRSEVLTISRLKAATLHSPKWGVAWPGGSSLQ